MPFTVSILSVNPDKINLPGSTIVSFNLNGSAGILAQITYLVPNDVAIVFSDTHSKSKNGPALNLTGTSIPRTETLSFEQSGNPAPGIFQLTVQATDVNTTLTTSDSTAVMINLPAQTTYAIKKINPIIATKIKPQVIKKENREGVDKATNESKAKVQKRSPVTKKKTSKSAIKIKKRSKK